MSITFTDLPLSLWKKTLTALIRSPSQSIVYTPNAEIAYRAEIDPQFRAILSRATLLAPDGDGVILGSCLANKPLRYGKRAGVELGVTIACICERENKSLFLFGGKSGVAERAAKRLKNRFPSLVIAGTASGYGFDPIDIANAIKASGADVVFVCLGSPMQEKWIDTYQSKTGAKLLIALGGSLDVYAGEVRRAPRSLRRCHAEWLYRLIKQPKRLRRMTAIPKYLLLCMKKRRKF